MSHPVPEYYQHVSERLSGILDKVGYSRRDRDRKVMLAKEIETFSNIPSGLRKDKRYVYMFGSRADGSTGNGLQSDYDFLHQLDDNKVVTDLKDCQPDKTNYLMVKDDFTHPGYVKLQSIYIFPDNTPFPLCTFIKIQLDFPIKSMLAFDKFNRVVASHNALLLLGKHMSGPAFQHPSMFKELSLDEVYAFRCLNWPQEGYEWFQRRRLHGWPLHTQIKKASGYGCFATPVGHPYSTEKQIEWRLSFSIAERDLVRSFEDTAMKVYILLKMIKKTYIQPVVGDAFSSYHCKICMLWMRERTPRDLWTNENLLLCLNLCMIQLYEWAIAGNCPDYFIATNNTYDRKILGPVQIRLAQQLEYLISTDGRALLEIQCCNLGHLLANRLCISDFNSIIRFVGSFHFEMIAEECMIISTANECRYTILKDIPQYFPMMVSCLETLVYSSKQFSNIVQYPLKFATMILWSQLGFYFATVCKDNACSLSQEQRDYLVFLASGCLSLGIDSDATSVRLKLCGLGMELGFNDLMEVCLRHISSYRMGYMYSVTNHQMSGLNSNIISNAIKRLTMIYSSEELMRTQVSFSVVYMPSEISITPKPLKIEMFRSVGAPQELSERLRDSWYDWGVVDSIVCLYFFQFQNFCRQGKERYKQVAMDNMIHVIRVERNISHRETAFNLLGYSFMQEHQHPHAFICFVQSLIIRPYHNAARLHLGILLRRVCSNHRTHVS